MKTTALPNHNIHFCPHHLTQSCSLSFFSASCLALSDNTYWHQAKPEPSHYSTVKTQKPCFINCDEVIAKWCNCWMEALCHQPAYSPFQTHQVATFPPSWTGWSKDSEIVYFRVALGPCPDQAHLLYYHDYQEIVFSDCYWYHWFSLVENELDSVTFHSECNAHDTLFNY